MWHVPRTVQQEEPQETLPELITRRLFELDRSARTAASNAHGLISNFTLSRYARGAGGKLEMRTAQGIALAIDVTLDEVLRAAGMPMAPGDFVLPERAHKLTSKERMAVIAVIDAMLGASDREPGAPPVKHKARGKRKGT